MWATRRPGRTWSGRTFTVTGDTGSACAARMSSGLLGGPTARQRSRCKFHSAARRALRSAAMAINWPKKRRDMVEKILTSHPPESGQCARAANKIWPHAVEQDSKAARWEVAPKMGRGKFLISTNVSLRGATWHWHVCVEADAHCVDAVTRAEGEPTTSYLAFLLKYPDEYELVPWDGQPIVTK